MKFKPIIKPGTLTPTPGRQMKFVGGIYGGTGIAGLTRSPKTVYRTWQFGASTITSIGEMRGLLPALGTRHKLGLRYGGTGEVTSIGSTRIGHMYMGGMPEADLPIPTYGVGLTSVPVGSSRMMFEGKKVGIDGKSRGGEHTSRSRTPEQARKSMRGPSAQRSKRSRRLQPYFRRDEDRYK